MFAGVQVCIEIVGYLLEELRDNKNYEQFKKDMADANIFIGSLIFIEELAEKVSSISSANCLCPLIGKTTADDTPNVAHFAKGLCTCADRGDSAASEGAVRCLPGLPVDARRHVSHTSMRRCRYLSVVSFKIP